MIDLRDRRPELARQRAEQVQAVFRAFVWGLFAGVLLGVGCGVLMVTLFGR